MNIYIYTDESGVFDKAHNDYYVFGGLLFLSKDDKNIAERRYHSVEKTIRNSNLNYKNDDELKACILSNKEKSKIFRSLNQYIKFGVIIDQSIVHDNIFDFKKSKQRYLDYAYKILIKKTLLKLSRKGVLNLSDIENIIITCDEHTTATNGKYELREGILEELKIGTINFSANYFYPPICKGMNDVQLNFADSKKVTLLRAADIIANRIYYHVVHHTVDTLIEKIHLIFLP